VPEVVYVQRVNAAVHEAVTVGGTDHGISRDIQDRVAVDGHEWYVAAEAFPSIGEPRLDRSEDDA
jgi:hypothetical protein